MNGGSIRLLVQTGFLALLVVAGLRGAHGQVDGSSAELGPPPEPGDRADADVPYVPTSPAVAERMLEIAEVGEDDVVADLGSGNGRLVIEAARRYGARGVGYEVDSTLVRKARARARDVGVAERVLFREQDFFDADLSEVTVVTLFLSDSVNLRLRSKLLEELEPGTAIVSHEFRMGEWVPDRAENYQGHDIFLWRVPRERPEF